MGIIRKTASFCTLGAIDWRSDKERIAKYGKATKKATKEQVKILRQQGR